MRNYFCDAEAGGESMCAMRKNVQSGVAVVFDGHHAKKAMALVMIDRKHGDASWESTRKHRRSNDMAALPAHIS